jgi:hypothetical protein
MSPSAEKIPGRLALLLAGLQAGMIAALAMLAWLGLSAVWERRSFWTSENLLATTFYGGTAVRNGFSTSTLSGLALYLLIYSIFGCLFAIAAGGRLSAPKLLLAGIAAALAWYYVSFHFLWSTLSPLMPLLHAVRPTVIGHIIFGAAIARFPQYLPRQTPVPIEPSTAEGAAAPTEVSDSPRT